MSTFAAAVQMADTPAADAFTANGMPTNASTGNAVLNCFFILGASRGKDISDQFRAALVQDHVLAVKALFWARDVRGGAGERNTFRKLLAVLEQHDVEMALRVIPLIAEYGRFDDLHVFNTLVCKNLAVQVHVDAIRAGNGLGAKWAPRKGPIANQLRKAMDMDPKTYRKTIVGLTNVVETQMCANQWGEINYSHVPSVASARLQKAFNRHDPVRYTEFKAAALKGEVKINAGTLFPYDVLKSVRNGDQVAALAQWEALPNYLGDNGFILPVIDVSGSMGSRVGDAKSTLTCMDVAISLGLYLADKQQGAFKDMFLNFHTNSKIHHLQGNLLEKIHQIQHSDWGGSTSLESAFKEILRVAVMGNVPPNEMPRYLLVISDMGFDPSSNNAGQGAMAIAKDIFARHNYSLPNIIWWNVAHRNGGYGGDNNFPVTQHESGSALISGFSPSIVRSVLSSKQVTPYEVMLETLNSDRYWAVEQALRD
jgi:hypothetical protein